MDFKRVTLFSGHYGSGKTNIAINYAMLLKNSFDNVCIADLDIVNPYFRTKDGEAALNRHKIKLISSEFASSNVDLPALPAETYAILDNPDLHAVIDVGGDDRGALALGRYAPSILDENNYEMLFVINKFRPLTRDCETTLEIMNEIENACNMKFTAIVNNSNLGEETTAENVLSSLDYANQIAEKTGLPVKMTCVDSRVAPELSGKIENVFPITLYVMQSWKLQEDR